MANKDFVRFANKLKNSSKSYKTPVGSIGYDNARENIDPHIKTKVVSGKHVYISGMTATGEISGLTYLGDGSQLTGITAPGDDLGNHIATQTISGQDIIMSGEISGASFTGDGDNLDIPLNTIENPEASKVFNFGNNKYLTFTSVDRTPIAGEGIFNFECSGNFTGDLVHIHQHTGNAGVGTVLLKLEAEDADIRPLVISGSNLIGIDCNKIISGQGLISAETISGQDIFTATDKKHYFRDTGLYINSSANGHLDISADTQLNLRHNGVLQLAIDGTGLHSTTLDMQTNNISGIGDATATTFTETTRGQFFIYKTSSQSMASNNTWYDLTWADVTAPVKQGFTHDHTSNPEQITVTNSGTYLISYMLRTYVDGAAGHYSARVLDDGTEISGSHLAQIRSYINSLEQTFIAKITANSVLKLQIGTDTAGIAIAYQATIPAPTTTVSATISITKLSNDS